MFKKNQDIANLEIHLWLNTKRLILETFKGDNWTLVESQHFTELKLATYRLWR